MSPAEITQQLGLQSLTRRPWVSFSPLTPTGIDTNMSPPTVHPVDLRHHW